MNDEQSLNPSGENQDDININDKNDDGATAKDASSVNSNDTLNAKDESTSGDRNDNEGSQDADYAFRWSWAPGASENTVGATAPPKKKKLSRGAVFGIIAASVFALAFIILAIALISDISLSLSDGDPMGNKVNINVSQSGATPTADGRASAEDLESFKNSVVVILSRTTSAISTGTGIIMTEDGYIATNYHVVENATTINVQLYNGESYIAEYIGGSESDDLAVLKIGARDLSPATFGRSSDCYLGENVYAVGTPANADFGWTVTSGSVSCVLRDVKIYNEVTGIYEKKMSVIQTDAPVNPGNSGGPLINSRCEVIGIITMKLSDGYVGMGFAIPIDGALEILVSIIENGNADNVDSSVSEGRPMLGIVAVSVEKGNWYESLDDRIARVDEEYAKENPDTTFYAAETGLYVTEVTAGYDSAGKLRVGDIITHLNGTPVTSVYDVSLILSESDAAKGDTVTLGVYRAVDRDEEYASIQIILG